MGGERNWDYRFTWLRDSAFTLNSLLKLGLYEEATDFAKWFLDRVEESQGGHMQPMFTIEGGHKMNEEILGHLEGYRNSSPVRIGNDAYKQEQLDVYGETLDAAHIFAKQRGVKYGGFKSMGKMMEWLSKNWQNKDEGIWEVRGGKRDFLHSRLMIWVAFDRAIKIAEQQSLPAPLEQWRNLRDTVYNEIMEKGWSEENQSFVQYYGGDAIDASALSISLTGFTVGYDERMVKTIERMQRELMNEPHLYRYRIETAASDGLKGTEGTFSICSFWLVEALTRAGKLQEARRYLEEMFTYANHLGLYSEEVGPTGEALGNFPQAFTHLALISSCLALNEALDKSFSP
ncbi:MAG TPA: glycoside hydrolase family 15 protein [Nitrososphaerales archaeon]|nr:glycoside hydrolase family 15 protein [Nitrososphaerales archaeon]